MRKNITLLLIIICNILSYSQLKQILVLNEGAFDFQSNQILVPVSIGSFYPSTGLYQKKNEIADARFASDIVIDGNSYWVAADKNVIQYDLSTHEKLAGFILEGVRKIAFYKDLMVVSRGEYLKTFDSYIQIYNKHTFELLFEIPRSTLPFTTESIIINHGIAYVAVNNGFDFGNEVGKLVKIDLEQLKLLETIDLGPDGKNPENLMIKDDLLISLNNKDYHGSSVSIIDDIQGISTFNLSNVNSLCGTSTLVGDNVVYQEIGKTDLGAFEINSKQSGFLNNLGKSYYGMSYDSNSGYLCAAETDFRTSGKVYIYDANLIELFSFDAGVTPGYFAFDHANSVGVHNADFVKISIVPNPVISFCKVHTNDVLHEISILDLRGKELVRTKNSLLNLAELESGTYIIKVKTKSSLEYRKILKI